MPLEIPAFISRRIDRPVAILGSGVSGEGAAALVALLGARASFYDRNGAEFTPEKARTHGLVVFSPGFQPGHPWLGIARDCGCMSIAELDFASVSWRGRVVAVTGTNG